MRERTSISWLVFSVLIGGISCSGAKSAPGNAASNNAEQSLIAAATTAYEAELDALRAYAREECHECPEEAPFFLAGSRYAFDKAVKLHPNDPSALLGLGNVLFSTAFEADGQPVDTTLAAAESIAVRAIGASKSDAAMRVAAETLLARIRRAR